MMLVEDKIVNLFISQSCVYFIEMLYRWFLSTKIEFIGEMLIYSLKRLLMLCRFCNFDFIKFKMRRYE